MPQSLSCPPPLCTHQGESAHPGPIQAPAPSSCPWPRARRPERRPLAPVTVTATAGDLLSVSMVNDAGKPVEEDNPDNTV